MREIDSDAYAGKWGLPLQREADAVERAAQMADRHNRPFAWARLGVYENSVSVLRRAISTAEEAGALFNAGLAALALIEGHGFSPA